MSVSDGGQRLQRDEHETFQDYAERQSYLHGSSSPVLHPLVELTTISSSFQEGKVRWPHRPEEGRCLWEESERSWPGYSCNSTYPRATKIYDMSNRFSAA